VVVDSSGNAGVAFATYAAHAGLGCEVFVPASTSLAKVGSMSERGAVVHAVKGAREAVAAAAIARVEETHAFYASHVWNPWFFEGTKRYVYELVEQLAGRLPGALVLPAGNGTLVLGAFRAIRELDLDVPIVAVQSELCAPIASAFAAGREHVTPVADSGTTAVGIAIAAPPRGDEVLAAVRATGGWFVTVSDDDLAGAAAELSAQGYIVEPTAAAPAAALAYLGADVDAAVVPLASGRRALRA
jgi:threonine synthase